MSFYNGILNHEDNHESGQIGPRGLPGVPGPKGDGYKLTSDGNYDIENKKLINVKPGTNNDDVVIKSQIQYLDGVLPAQVTNNKAVIYSPSGGMHANALYLKDQYGQEVNFHTEDQDLNQCRLYVPNLKNNDSYGGRRKSSVVVTSIDQTIQGKKIFHDIEVPKPTSDNQASNKKYVDNKIQELVIDHSNFVTRSGDTMTGSLIIPKDNYPVQGDHGRQCVIPSSKLYFIPCHLLFLREPLLVTEKTFPHIVGHSAEFVNPSNPSSTMKLITILYTVSVVYRRTRRGFYVISAYPI